MSLVPIAAAAAGTLAAAAYLDAKFHIRHDLNLIRVAGNSRVTMRFLEDCICRDRMMTFHILEDQVLHKRPNQLFLIFENRTWTYLEFYRCLLRAGNWLLKDLGIQRGEIVALDGGNSPEYMMLWFALEGIGAIPSFVNNHLTGQSLVHCIKLCECRYILCDSENKHNVEPCEDELGGLGVQTVYYNAESIGGLKDETSLPEHLSKGWKATDMCSLLYTSGSTGLPKAVMLIRGRELMVGYSISRYLRLKPSDRFYTCMPLYHGAAHALLVTPSIHAGNIIVLGRKFSHSTFWPEVRASRANKIQYVGELCRYLVNAPPSPLDKEHHVEMAWGNGLRPDIWEKFRERFGIPVINELYAATDGLGASFNENRGDFTKFAIGKRGLIYRLLRASVEVLVKIDPDTEDVLRNENGFAMKCKIGEPGEVIHEIDPQKPDAAFHGYFKNKAAGDKRKIKDVFRKGDLWFRSGDMHRMDSDGRVYFVDRLGDTFRWKSENVSTNEVSDVLGQHPHIAEANVYGVTIPNADGRCGMAAIVLAEGIKEETADFRGLAKHVLETLPRYAVPYFMRITSQLDYTGTLKMQKGRLKREGIDVETIEELGDKMYWLPPDGREYITFTKTDHDSLKVGKVRL